MLSSSARYHPRELAVHESFALLDTTPGWSATMPPTNLIDESLGWLVVALGGMALGLVGLLRKRPASPAWRAGVAGALLGLAGGAWGLGLPSSVALALAVLAGLQALRVGCQLGV